MASSERMLLDFSNRKIKDNIKKQVDVISGLCWFELTVAKANRSVAANAYYWSCIVKSLRDFEESQGNSITAKECHSILGGMFLRFTLFDRNTGEIYGEGIKSTSTLSTSEFSAYVDKCKVWLLDTLGVICPDPTPYFK